MTKPVRRTSADFVTKRSPDQYADGTNSGDQKDCIAKILRHDVETAAEAFHAARAKGDLQVFAGADVGRVWRDASLESRREATHLLVDATIHPTGYGNLFSPDSVGTSWRQD